MSEDKNADQEEGVDIADPYGQLVPVLAGLIPENGGYALSERMGVFPVEETDRNLWHLDIDEKEVVTFDADAFATTTNLGLYIDGVVEGLDNDLEQEDHASEDDPRRLDANGGSAFQ